MFNIKFIYLLIFMSFSAITYSQWTEDWDTTATWTSSSIDIANDINYSVNKFSKVKGGYIYVTGYVYDALFGWAIRTYKYNSSGTVQSGWPASYTSLAELNVKGIDVDVSGNVYIVGQRGTDYLTIKYNSSGTQQWAVTYDGGGFDRGNAIVVDNSGNVYVTGASDSSGTWNIFTIKYNSSGTQQWGWHFNKGGSLVNTEGDDEAFGITIDTNSAHPGYGIYVVGWYDDGNNCVGPIDTNCLHDAQIIHYNFDGTVGGHRHYGCGPDNGEDWATDVVVAADGDVYSVGAKWCKPNEFTYYGHQFMVMKCYWDTDDDPPVFKMDYGYCSNARYYNAGADGGENIGVSLVVDGDEYVYATGYSDDTGSGREYVTIKFDTDGTHEWVSNYNSSSTNDDLGQSIAISSGFVYVTGTTKVNDFDASDITTIQYNGSTGAEVCVATYNGFANVGDQGGTIGVDGSYIYVVGTSNIDESPYKPDYVLLRYSPCDDGDDDMRNVNLMSSYNLSQNYPNPFNPTTNIKYFIPAASLVTLKIYNALGQIVFDIPVKYRAAGEYSELIDGTSWASGVYFYKIEVSDVSNSVIKYEAVQKMLLIK